MFNSNTVIVTTQKELDIDINKQFRIISVCPVLNTFIPGVVCLKYILDEKKARGTACTDGAHVYISATYWNTMNGNQKVGLIFHEMLHCLWLHFYRFRGCTHWIANLATDYVIDRFIRQLETASKYISEPPDPPGGTHPRTDKYGELSEEAIYNDLTKAKDEDEAKEKEKSEGDGDGSGDPDDGEEEDTEEDSSGEGEGGEEGEEEGDGDGSGEGSDGDPDEGGGGDGSGDPSGGEGEGDGKGDGKGDTPDPTKPDPYTSPGGFMEPPGDLPGDDEEDGEESGDGDGEVEKKKMRDPHEVMREMRDQWAETQQVIAQTARLKGNIPGGIVEMFEQEPARLDWVSILANWCLALSSCDIDEEHFDRRFLGEGEYLESIDRPAVENIIFAKDTSGSMWTNWLATSCSEIQGAMQVANIKRLWVLDIDCSMQGLIQEYGPNDQIDFSARGRGGTDFRPPFEWAKDECPANPCALIYFTDGYGPFPDEAPPYPVLWLTFGLDPEDYPFGDVIDMRQVPRH